MSRILTKYMVCYYDIKCMMVLHEKKERKIKEKSKECNADSPYTRTKQCVHCKHFLNVKDSTQ